MPLASFQDDLCADVYCFRDQTRHVASCRILRPTQIRCAAVAAVFEMGQLYFPFKLRDCKQFRQPKNQRGAANQLVKLSPEDNQTN